MGKTSDQENIDLLEMQLSAAAAAETVSNARIALFQARMDAKQNTKRKRVRQNVTREREHHKRHKSDEPPPYDNDENNRD